MADYTSETVTHCAYCGLKVEQRDGEWMHATSGRVACYAQHGITGPRAVPAKPDATAYRPDCPACRRRFPERAADEERPS